MPSKETDAMPSLLGAVLFVFDACVEEVFAERCRNQYTGDVGELISFSRDDLNLLHDIIEIEVCIGILVRKDVPFGRFHQMQADEVVDHALVFAVFLEQVRVVVMDGDKAVPSIADDVIGMQVPFHDILKGAGFLIFDGTDWRRLQEEPRLFEKDGFCRTELLDDFDVGGMHLVMEIGVHGFRDEVCVHFAKFFALVVCVRLHGWYNGIGGWTDKFTFWDALHFGFDALSEQRSILFSVFLY